MSTGLKYRETDDLHLNDNSEHTESTDKLAHRKMVRLNTINIGMLKKDHEEKYGITNPNALQPDLIEPLAKKTQSVYVKD